jgi:hypothetical protein
MSKFHRVVATATFNNQWDSFCWHFCWTETGYFRRRVSNGREHTSDSTVPFDDFADLSSCLDWFSDNEWDVKKTQSFLEAQ